MKVRETHLTWCFPSLVTWRIGVLSWVSAVSREWAGQTQSAWRCQLEKLKDVLIQSSKLWFPLLVWHLYTGHLSYHWSHNEQTPVISNSVFFSRKWLFPQGYVEIGLNGVHLACACTNMHSVCFLCQVKCCAWCRCERHSSRPHLACRLLGVPNPSCVHFSFLPPMASPLRRHSLSEQRQRLLSEYIFLLFLIPCYQISLPKNNIKPPFQSKPSKCTYWWLKCTL